MRSVTAQGGRDVGQRNLALLILERSGQPLPRAPPTRQCRCGDAPTGLGFKPIQWANCQRLKTCPAIDNHQFISTHAAAHLPNRNTLA
jgi:hypothetical protein